MEFVLARVTIGPQLRLRPLDNAASGTGLGTDVGGNGCRLGVVTDRTNSGPEQAIHASVVLPCFARGVVGTQVRASVDTCNISMPVAEKYAPVQRGLGVHLVLLVASSRVPTAPALAVIRLVREIPLADEMGIVLRKEAVVLHFDRGRLPLAVFLLALQRTVALPAVGLV